MTYFYKTIHVLKYALFPIVYLFLDIYFRYELLKLYSTEQLAIYCLSVIYSILQFGVIVTILARLSAKKYLFYSATTIISVYYTFVILASYTFFHFNGVFPNFYTFAYFKNEPASAFSLLKDSIHSYQIIGFLIVFTLFWTYLTNLSTKQYVINKYINISLVIAVLILFAFFEAKIYLYDQCLIVDTNFASVITRHLIDWNKGKSFEGSGLSYRKAITLDKLSRKSEFNVLVIIFESLRKQNLNIYGYNKNTSPFLSNLLKTRPDELFVFKEPYTVSSTTMLAIPAILNGIAPYQPKDLLFSYPLIWNYAQMLDYNTFFVSSHSMKWYNFDKFYAHENLDHFWNKEISNFPNYNDFGIDDRETVKHLNSYIRTISTQNFFGVIQFNATHYPYTIPKEFDEWDEEFIDVYNNANVYQDYLLQQIFQNLEESKKLENTVVIMVGDHGEAFKEHNNIGHVDSYYLETISIPLMVYLPKKVSKSIDMKYLRENLSKKVQNIDIAPTIIDLLGIKANKKITKLKSNMLGTSLFQNIDPKRAIITMNNNEIARYRVGLSLIKDNYHYLYRTNIVPNREELYNIIKDKSESANIIKYFSKAKLDSLKGNFLKHKISNYIYHGIL